MMLDLDLSIIVCSWNTKDDLRACLASLQSDFSPYRVEVIVVDNNSEDGSADMVAAEFPHVVLHRMASNLGFTGGNNFALQERRGRNALLLNSDTIVHDDAIRTMLEFLQGEPKLGVVGPRLLNTDGSLQLSCRRFPNPIAALFRNTPVGRLFPNNKFTREYLMTDWDHSSSREVDWVSGAALLASEKMIEKVGFLDPEYFMYCEDVDWCFRAWQAGFTVAYLPSATITHAIGRSTDKAPNRMIGRFHRSMFRFYRLHMVPKLPIWWRPFALLGSGTALLLRAGLFITKNKVDILRRWLKR